MKLLLNCDDVFERLTRGPFPSNEDDGSSEEDTAVETHLHACHECRQLAEALRPAVELLHEAYPEAAEAALPAYHGQLLPPTVCVANSVPTALSWSGGWQLVAAGLLGLMVGILAVGGWFSRDGRSHGNFAWVQSSEIDPANSYGLAKLAGLKLNEVCLPSGMSLASNQRLRCCTDCHAASKAGKKSVDVARLQLACLACHDPQHDRN